MQAIRYLIAIFPMASLNDGIVKFAPIEELVECIFRLVIQISLEFTAEEELPRHHISFLALDWLCELWYDDHDIDGIHVVDLLYGSKSPTPPRALLQALSCLVKTKSIYVSAASQTWRKPPSSPHKHSDVGVSFIRALTDICLCEPDEIVLSHIVFAVQGLVHIYSHARYADEISSLWFRDFLDVCRNHTNQQMRLMAARTIETIVSSELTLENRAPVSPDMYHLGSGFSNSLILPDPLFVNMRKVRLFEL